MQAVDVNLVIFLAIIIFGLVATAVIMKFDAFIGGLKIIRMHRRAKRYSVKAQKFEPTIVRVGTSIR